jgi:hypothetical protein
LHNLLFIRPVKLNFKFIPTIDMSKNDIFQNDTPSRRLREQTPSRQLWDPIAQLNIRSPGNKLCCNAFNEKLQPCGYEMSREQRDDIHHLIKTMEEKDPHDTIDEMPQLAYKTLCNVHRRFKAQVNRNQEKWTDIILNIPPSPARGYSTGHNTVRSTRNIGQETPSRSPRSKTGIEGEDIDNPFNRISAVLARLSKVERQQARLAERVTKCELEEQSRRVRLALVENRLLGTNGQVDDVKFDPGSPQTVHILDDEKKSSGRSFTLEELEEDVISETSTTLNAVIDLPIIFHPLFNDFVVSHKQLLHRRVLDHIKSASLPVPLFTAFTETAAAFGYEYKESNIGFANNYCGKSTAEGSKQSGGAQGKKRKSDDENDDDDAGQRRRKRGKERANVDPGEFLACPYFQRNSQGPRLHRACRGPGFESIHRLK